MIEINQIIPNFELKNQNDETVTLNDIKGKYTIIYFYPKDLTSGCTIQANQYNELLDEFTKENITIIGVSKDEVKSHKKFCEKNNLKFTLLSDPNLEMIQYFDVWKEKSMYGKKYMGVVRSSFILDSDLKVIRINLKAKPASDASECLEFIRGL